MRRLLASILLLAASVAAAWGVTASVMRATPRPALVTVRSDLATVPPPAGSVTQAGAALPSATPTPAPPAPASTPVPLSTTPPPRIALVPRATPAPAAVAHPPVGPPIASVPPSPTPSAPSPPGAAPTPTPPATPPSPTPSAPRSQPSRSQVIAIISAAAAAHGVDPATLVRVASCESSLNPAAVNPAGPYIGLFQFWPPTFYSHGGNDIWDASQQADVAARMFAAGQGGAWACQ